jgi:hypothetical protein
MYDMAYTTPNIAYAMGVLNRYILNLGKQHWTIVKRIFVYLWGTSYYLIFYQATPRPNKELDVQGFFYSNWVGYLDC